jgi:Zn-dependent protease with chaperone function
MDTTQLCRLCGQPVEPATNAVTGPSLCDPCRNREEFAHKVLNGFVGPIPPAPRSRLYGMAIALVAIAMALLPLLYVSMIAALAIGVLFYAVDWGPRLLAEPHGGQQRGQLAALLIGYFGPLVAGGTLVIFMLKPLLAGKPKQVEDPLLDPADEPLLFQFVARLCELLGAPKPREIRVNCQVNASASFRKGWTISLRPQLVLTIGAPLLAGLSLREFTGVLAHEFGHFAQRRGMGMTNAIRSVNGWFARVVYHRDGWDQALIDGSNTIPIRELKVILYFTRFCVWLTRRILWVLMMIGHAISCLLLRQMEVDADRQETLVAGSDSFATTMDRLEELTLAWRGAVADLGEAFRDGLLPDNLCDLLLVNVSKVPPEVVQKLREAREKQKTRLFDTHPCNKDRVTNAVQLQAAGVFQIEGAATTLLCSFPRLACQATESFYRQALGDKFRQTALVPTARFLGRQADDLQADEVHDRYFRGAFNPLRPLPLRMADTASTQSPTPALAELREACERGAADYQQHFRFYDTADTRRILAEQAAALLKAGLKIRPADFGLGQSALASAEAMITLSTGLQQNVTPKLEAYEKIVEQRLLAALGLLRSADAADKWPEAAAWLAEAQNLMAVGRDLAQVWPALLNARNTQACLAILLQNCKGQEANKKFVETLQATCLTLRRQIDGVLRPLERTIYPFEHAIPGASVARYTLEKMPHMNDLGAIFSSSDLTQRQLHLLSLRIAKRLAVIAENIEGPSTAAAPVAAVPPDFGSVVIDTA